MPDKPALSLDENRYISMEDNVALPLLYMAYPTVYAHHDDEAPLDVLSSILGQGETSLLYKNMVKNRLAVQAGAGHACAELACTFTMVSVASPPSGATLADLEKIARDSLLEFEERGVLDDDLTRVKMSIVSGMIFGLESVAGKVGRLAAYQTYGNNPNFTADGYRPLRKREQRRRHARLSSVHTGQTRRHHECCADRAARECCFMRIPGLVPERQLPEYACCQ